MKKLTVAVMIIGSGLISACGQGDEAKVTLAEKAAKVVSSAKVQIQPIELFGVDLRKTNMAELSKAVEAAGGVIKEDTPETFRKVYKAEKLLEDAAGLVLSATETGEFASAKYVMGGRWGDEPKIMRRLSDMLKMKYGAPSKVVSTIEYEDFLNQWDRGNGYTITLKYDEFTCPNVVFASQDGVESRKATFERIRKEEVAKQTKKAGANL